MTLYWGKENPFHEAALRFANSRAVIIGINAYSNGIPKLESCVRDATRLKQILQDDHDYDDVRLLLDDAASANGLRDVLGELPSLVGDEDRLLIYYAGHGIRQEDDEGRQRFYLIPHGAKLDDPTTLLEQEELDRTLRSLTCRHLLLVLDCCFAGAPQDAPVRSRSVLPRAHRQRFRRYASEPARQVLTSATQEALDKVVIGGEEFELGKRKTRKTVYGDHSPFAAALFEALSGEGDTNDDGLMPLPELYWALVDRMPDLTGDNAKQDPSIRNLAGHGNNAHFFFQVPGYPLTLEDAPSFNPWKGREPYGEHDYELFSGRERDIEELETKVTQPSAAANITILTGPPHSGKTSLVQAGLIPRLKSPERADAASETANWHILTLLPDNPFGWLADWSRAAEPLFTVQSVQTALETWHADHADSHLLLIIDDLNYEIPALPGDVLLAAKKWEWPWLQLLLVLRTDHLAELRERTLLPAADELTLKPPGKEELTEIVTKPAQKGVLFFESQRVIEQIVDDARDEPGGLALLSEFLHALYEAYHSQVEESDEGDRLLRLDYLKLQDSAVDAGTGPIGAYAVQRAAAYYELQDHVSRSRWERIWLRMVAIETGGDRSGRLAARTVARAALDYPDDVESPWVDDLLTAMLDERLVVYEASDTTARASKMITPAHSALAISWTEINEWLRRAVNTVPFAIQRELETRALNWKLGSGSEAGDAVHRPGLWDTEPRLDLVQNAILEVPTGSSRLRAYFPRLRMRSEPSWFNRVESEFVVESIKRRSLRRWLGAGSITLLVIAVLAISGLAFSLKTQLDVNERQRIDLMARLLDSWSREIEREEPLESLVLGLQALTLANDLEIRHNILTNLVERNLQTGQVRFLHDDVRAITPVLGGEYIFVDRRGPDVKDLLFSTDSGELSELDGDVHLLTTITPFRTTINEGFYGLAGSEAFIIDYSGEQGQVRAGESIITLDGEIESIFLLDAPGSAIIDYVAHPDVILTVGSRVVSETLGGELGEITPLESSDLLLVQIQGEEEMAESSEPWVELWTRRDGRDETADSRLCSSDYRVVEAAGVPFFGINYADSAVCPSEIRSLVSGELAPAPITNIVNILPVPGSSVFVVNHTDTSELRWLADDWEHEVLTKTISAIATSARIPYFVISYGNFEREVRWLDNPRSSVEPFGELTDPIKLYPRKGGAESYQISGMVFDSGLDFYAIEWLGCRKELVESGSWSRPTPETKCARRFGSLSDLRFFGDEGEGILLARNPIESINAFPETPFFTVAYADRPTLELRLVDEPRKAHLRSISRDLVNISHVSEHAFIFHYRRAGGVWWELWRLAGSDEQTIGAWEPLPFPLCNSSVTVSDDDIPWVIVNARPSCWPQLVNLETGQNARKPVPFCSDPFRSISATSDPTRFVMNFCNLPAQLYDMADGSPVVGIQSREQLTGSLRVDINTNDFSTVLDGDEELIELGTGTDRIWLKELQQLMVRFPDGTVYLIDPTLPYLANLAERQEGSYCVDEACVRVFACGVLTQPGMENVNWEQIREIVDGSFESANTSIKLLIDDCAEENVLKSAYGRLVQGGWR